MRRITWLLLSVAFPVLAVGQGPFCDPQTGWGPTSELTVGPVETFDNPAEWRAGIANEWDKISLSKTASPYGSALRVDYDLPANAQAGSFVYFVKPTAIDISKAGRIRFWVRGNGRPNRFDFKMSDADGGTFMRAFHTGAGTSDWHRETIDMAEMYYAFGGTNMTPEPPFKLDFGICRPYLFCETGGKGWIEIAGLEQIGAHPHLQLSMNQIGFDPEMSKRAVIQLLNNDEEISRRLTYSLSTYPDGKVVKKGKAPKFKTSALWPGQYWVVSLDDFDKPGRYTLKASLPVGRKSLVVESYPFDIKQNALAEELSWSQFHYIKFTRYPEHPRHADPVPGGYIDTEFDIERWMSTTPTWVWGMGCWQNLLSGQIPAAGFDPVDELRYAARFCIAMQKPDAGKVYYAEKSSKPSGYEEDMTPEEDPFDCFLMDPYAPEVEGAFVVAMAEVYKALGKDDPKLAGDSLSAAVKAWQYLSRQNLVGVQYLGMYLWASTRLYAMTGEGRYLEAAKKTAKELLPHQFLDYERSQEGVFGVFFWKPDKSDFDYQYKLVHSIGIYLGLMELAEALPEDDPLGAEIRFSMDCFAYGFLQQTARLNPYGKVAQSMEPPVEGIGNMQLYYFASPRCSWTDHGFNCDILSLGLIALRYARFSGNAGFAKIAGDQIGWVLGANPSGFCMVSGKGVTNPHLLMTDVNKGPVLGGIPNGFVSHCARNKPQWMTEWNSEEYWKPHNAMMLALMSELESDILKSPPSSETKNTHAHSLDEVKARISPDTR